MTVMYVRVVREIHTTEVYVVKVDSEEWETGEKDNGDGWALQDDEDWHDAAQQILNTEGAGEPIHTNEYETGRCSGPFTTEEQAAGEYALIIGNGE